MKFKNIFSIFLVLVLVSIGVYFVAGHVKSAGNVFTAPADTSAINVSYIYGNQTVTVTFNTSWTNITNVIVYNITKLNGGFVDYTALNETHNFNETYQANFTTSASFVLNTANYTQGNYTFTVFIVNNRTLNNTRAFNDDINLNTTYKGDGINSTYVNISFIIDNEPPRSMILIQPDLNGTLINNLTVQFGFNVTDVMSGNGTRSSPFGGGSRGAPLNCSLVVDNVVKNSSIVVSNSSTNYTNYYYFNVTSTDIDSGFHTWNVSCADINNNINASASWVHGTDDGVGVRNNYMGARHGNFTLTDTIGPTTATPTFSASSVTQNTAVTVTCTGTDGITANPREYVSVKGPLSGDWQGDIGVSPYSYTGTDNVGTYTVRCRSTDSAGIFGGYSSETTFAVTRVAGSSQTSDGGGAASGGTTTVTVATGQSKDLGVVAEGGEGVINAYRASTVTFSIMTSSETVASSHSIVFGDINYIKGEATITISSDPVTLTLKVGDTKMVDMDSDGKNDLGVNLVSIDENGQANMKIKDITEITPTEGETQPTEGETVSAGEGTKGSSSWIWWILIIVVVIVIIALLMPKKKRK